MQNNEKNKNKKFLQSERKRVGNASVSNLAIDNKHLFSLWSQPRKSPIHIFLNDDIEYSYSLRIMLIIFFPFLNN